MKIAVCQFHPEFGNVEANLAAMESMILQHDADLFILPELAACGYQFISREETASFAESIPDGRSCELWSDLSVQKNCYICAGLPERAGSDVFNSSVLIGPEGVIGTYRKVHLFQEEKQWFTPGNRGFEVWQIAGCRVGMMICFDWLFPEAARSLALQGADVILHPVNLVLPFCQQAMITRSIENGVYTVTANRVGSEARGGKPRLTFTGASQVVDPRGHVLLKMGQESAGVAVVEIDPLAARDKMICRENHLLQDRRENCYYPGMMNKA